MDRRLAWVALSCCGLLLAASGCAPKCREIRPLGEVRERLRDRVDDRLDDADVSDAQRARIQALFAALLPATERMREVTLPAQRAMVSELRRDAPDRARLAQLVDQNAAATEQYLRALVDVMLKAHPVLTREQRRRLAARESEPSEPLQGSFWIDRAADYLLARIDATDEQRRLAERIKRHLLARGRVLQVQADAVRAQIAAEFARDKPDRARLDAALRRASELTRKALVEVTGFYLLFATKLEPRQRALLQAELVRFEPCQETNGGARQLSTAAEHPRPSGPSS